MAIHTDLGTTERNVSILLHSGVILTTQEEGSGQAVQWVNSLRPWADPSLSAQDDNSRGYNTHVCGTK